MSVDRVTNALNATNLSTSLKDKKDRIIGYVKDVFSSKARVAQQGISISRNIISIAFSQV
jgi:hypothetical protein